MISTPHKYKKFNLPINKKRHDSSSIVVVNLINFIHKERILGISK